MLYGRPYGLNVTHDENLAQDGSQYIYDYLMATNKQLHQKFSTVFENQSKQPDHKLHAIDPGGWVCVKNFTGDPLQEKRDGLFQVLLSTFMRLSKGKTCLESLHPFNVLDSRNHQLNPGRFFSLVTLSVPLMLTPV